MGKADKREARLQSTQLIIEYFSKAANATVPAVQTQYVRKARTLAMRYRKRIPIPWNRRYCRSCNAYWVPGVNMRQRVRNGVIVYRCLACQHIRKLGPRAPVTVRISQQPKVTR